MNLNIKQLEALYWAGRLGSFQAAANRLHTTQSAISKRVAELESTLGHSLFDRSRRNAQLTPAGERVAAGAEQMLSQAKRLLEDLGETQEYESSFRLGATELIALTWLADLMRALRSTYPRLRLEVEVRNGGVILEGMNRGKYDLALLPGPMWGRLFDAVPLRTLERAWMASPKMGIPRRVLSVEELSEYPIASQFPDTIHAQLQSAWFTRAGFPLRNLVQADGFAVLGEMARTGIAVAQLPVGYYTPELKHKQLVRLKVQPELPDVEYFAIYRRATGHALAGAVAKIAKAHCNFAATSTVRSMQPLPAPKPIR
jgi:DNA-binding transcriptional LysR family regulator